jgi:hypothetical protein
MIQTDWAYLTGILRGERVKEMPYRVFCTAKEIRPDSWLDDMALILYLLFISTFHTNALRLFFC